MKRINFELDTNVAKSFTEEAKKKGTTRSKLLREWIRTSPTTDHIGVNTGQVVTNFNFALGEDEQKELESAVKDAGISQTGYLRLLIKTNLTKPKNIHQDQYHQQTLSNLLSIGRFKDADLFAEKYSEKLNAEHYILLIKSNVMLGNLSKAKYLIDKVESTYRFEEDSLVAGKFYLAEAAYFLLQPNLVKFQMYIDRAEDIFKSYGYQKGLGEVMYEKAHYNAIKFNCKVSSKLHQDALESFATLDSNFEMTRSLLALSRTLHENSNPEASTDVLHQVHKLLEKEPNEFLIGCYKHEIQVNNYLKSGELDSKFLDSITHFDSNGMSIRKYSVYTNLGFIMLGKGNFDLARSYLKKALEWSDRQRPGYGYCTARLLINFIDAKDNYIFAKRNIDMLISENRQDVQVQTGVYFQSLMTYLYSENSTEKSMSYRSLQKLKVESEHGLLKNAATMALEKKLPTLIL